MAETTQTQISEHVYWMPPTQPYNPSLCAVVGAERTLMLDAGASAEHARQFLDALVAKGLRPPDFVALTHYHFDHIMGASVVGVPVIAHSLTSEKIAALAKYDVSDPAHAERKASGDHVASTAETIQDQLSDPQGARLVQPSLIVHERLEVRLGGMTCRIEHVGGDHAADSCAMFVEPDGVLFLGDSLYNSFSPISHFTRRNVFPLLDVPLGFGAESFIQGHTFEVTTRAQMETLAGIIRMTGRLVQEIGADEAAVLAAAQAETRQAPDEDTIYFTQQFIVGREYE